MLPTIRPTKMPCRFRPRPHRDQDRYSLPFTTSPASQTSTPLKKCGTGIIFTCHHFQYVFTKEALVRGAGGGHSRPVVGMGAVGRCRPLHGLYASRIPVYSRSPVSGAECELRPTRAGVGPVPKVLGSRRLKCCRDHCLLQITGVGSRVQEPTNTIPGSGPFQRY